jgi:aspartyl-tRNA(Asn)/glutamyl-tRNA(Gln) amidotransferase subunit B
MEFETVIGLEIHAQLLTNTKIFCGCPVKFGDKPNTHGCPVCLGLPGALPVLNRKAVEYAILMGIATNCEIAKKSIFARKNYFYPDLPKGYQISQHELPICKKGYIEIDIEGTKKRIGISRIHLEEDAGKLIHDQDEDSLFDVNRCGTPLIEIVTEPDIRSPQEAYAFLSEIKLILEYLNICDCNMEEGSLRCDANISIRPKGEKKLGTKVELKNMNSFRGVEKALEYEAKRQKEAILYGEKIVQQTFLWDQNQNKTLPMRTKEDAHDYRYFPEPDLLPLTVEQELIDKLIKQMPELPSTKRERFITSYQITPYMSEVITSSRELADYFENTFKFCNDAKLVANWIMSEILRITKENKISISKLNITPKRLGSLLNLLREGVISSNTAKKVFDSIHFTNKEPEEIIEEQGLKQISDSNYLEKTIKDVLLQNPKEVERFKGGESKLMGFFVGQVMKSTKGKGNPKEINRIILELLKKN